MEELIAEQCALIARLMAEIDEAREIAADEGCEVDKASPVDLIRQMAHKISQLESEATDLQKECDKWEETADKVQKEYDDLVDENEKTLDEERQLIEDAIEDLLMALGHPRRPIGSTGVKELDHLAWLVF